MNLWNVPTDAFQVMQLLPSGILSRAQDILVKWVKDQEKKRVPSCLRTVKAKFLRLFFLPSVMVLL